MASSDWAAWTQAAVAALTIVTTAYLSRRDAGDRRAAAIARARSAAIAVFPALVDELASLSWAVHQLEAGCKVGEIGRDGPGEDDAIALWHTNTMTPALESARPFIHELRGEAEPVQRAYLALEILKSTYHDFCESANDGGPAWMWDWSDESEAEIVAKTRAALSRCKEAVDALGRSLGPSQEGSWLPLRLGR